MPGTVADGPTVPASFANNFWGKDDVGVQPLLERMHNAKVTSDELKSFYNTRASIEDDYARKLLSLCRKPLGSCEAGTLRQSLDVTRGEVESMAKAHQSIAAQMKTELEEPLVAFSGGLKERRKIVQGGIEKLLKVKVQQTAAVNKARDKFEQDCLRIKGYLAQGHMVMGQEERKNKAKLEKTQIQMAAASNEYEIAVKALEETTGRWNRDWKLACDKFQDFEEERLDFTKSSLWSFANIASTVCVSDDAACERVRLALENCEVEKDIRSFISERGTGQEIPDAPKYINFCRGDINDSASEASDDENYSVAQFQRTINPAFRTSSPAPSTLESHNDPNSDLARRMNAPEGSNTPRSRETTVTPQRNGQAAPQQPDFRRQAADVQAQFQQNQGIELASFPHNEYPADGMTMFCRSDNQSDLSSAHSPVRPRSQDSHSEYSNPTSFSSVEPVSGNTSPTKQMGREGPQEKSPDKAVQKRRSGFFSNSPFRRKSKHEKERPGSHSTWGPSSKNTSPIRGGIQTHDFADDMEPVDPRANFQLNVGQNVFDVASPDSQHNEKQQKKSGQPTYDESDPIAAALAELKGVTKQSSVRMSADRYHGLATPAPGSQMQHPAASAQRGTPPPSYNDMPPMKRLDLPQPAHTSAQMRAATSKYTNQNADMYGGSRPGSNSAHGAPRSASPLPIRSASPRPGLNDTSYRATSPAPPQNQYGSAQRRPRPQSASPQKPAYSSYSRQGSPGDVPQPQYARQERPSSAGTMGAHNGGVGGGGGMALQLSQGDAGALDQRRDPRRPVSYYGGAQGGQQHNAAMGNGEGRSRSKSLANGRQFTRDGRPIIHFARAMYSYTAAIPEELSFSKNEVLAVLRLQDDGWWEAEATGKKGRPGLVPSNYLQRC